MAIVPTNITGEIVEWVPTNEIRFAGRRRKSADLQQLWRNLGTGEEEWRDVEFVHTAEG